MADDENPYAVTYQSEGMLCFGCSADGYATAMGREAAERLVRKASPGICAKAIPYSEVPARLQLPEFRDG